MNALPRYGSVIEAVAFSPIGFDSPRDRMPSRATNIGPDAIRTFATFYRGPIQAFLRKFRQDGPLFHSEPSLSGLMMNPGTNDRRYLRTLTIPKLRRATEIG